MLKYLKIYENFDKKDYSEISEEEYYDAMDKLFNTDTINQFELGEIISKIDKKRGISYTFIQNKKSILIPSSIYGIRIKKSNKKVLNIIKAKDEWFYISCHQGEYETSYEYYKCDQSRGVVEFLNSTESPIIKLFDKQNESKIYEEFNIEDYYTKTDWHTYSASFFTIGIFTQIEEKNLKEFLNNLISQKFDVQYEFSYDNSNYRNSKLAVKCGLLSEKMSIHFDINKTNDEWFYCMIKIKDLIKNYGYGHTEVEYYKCDQVGGVIELLENVIKNGRY